MIVPSSSGLSLNLSMNSRMEMQSEMIAYFQRHRHVELQHQAEVKNSKGKAIDVAYKERERRLKAIELVADVPAHDLFEQRVIPARRLLSSRSGPDLDVQKRSCGDHSQDLDAGLMEEFERKRDCVDVVVCVVLVTSLVRGNSFNAVNTWIVLVNLFLTTCAAAQLRHQV
ncbi:hypothetical protein FE257_004356 [Aspergillus nanangensis]|uniref:Uncharacterized protein n=1 Tax=Aspergillus nanangensis TaxID=2582783 RepID=A0AAD4GN49_ASPNN|nr:hypothetical protein FE257_004356 [Aspergillus nanangensis]